MYCEKCGEFVPNGSNFCTKCGAPVQQPQPQQQYAQPQQPQPQQPQKPQQQPQYAQQPGAVNGVTDSNILTWGILGLAFACSFFLSFLGIIFSAIARGKVKKYIAGGGAIYGKAKVGKILALIGLIAGIVLTVIFVIYLIAIGSWFNTFYWYF